MSGAISASFAAELVSKYTEAVIFDYVDELRAMAVVLVLMWFLLRFINKVERNFIEKRMKENLQFDQTAVDAIGKLLRATTVITAILVLMQTFGFSIGGILAFGGVGGIAGTVRSSSRFSASSSPWIVPPWAVSMTGKCRRSRMSPATITSARRKCTSTSPSEVAPICRITCTASSFRYIDR